jgi:hypothetical protein
MKRTGLALVALCAAAGGATANIVDLTAPMSQGMIGGVIFETSDFRAGGTGIINSFVRVSSNNAVVQGYNTSGRPVAFDENTSPNFTRNLTFGEVPVRVINGVEYKEFLLDINQMGAAPLISLDKVQIYTSSIGSQTTSNVSSLGALVYDMDASKDSYVKLDYNLGTGSGQGDMRMYVPVSAFGSATAGTFVYLYSMFGQNFANNDGFEEWAVLDAGPVVPLPPSVWAGGASLIGIGLVRSVRRRSGR